MNVSLSVTEMNCITLFGGNQRCETDQSSRSKPVDWWNKEEDRDSSYIQHETNCICTLLKMLIVTCANGPMIPQVFTGATRWWRFCQCCFFWLSYLHVLETKQTKKKNPNQDKMDDVNVCLFFFFHQTFSHLQTHDYACPKRSPANEEQPF